MSQALESLHKACRIGDLDSIKSLLSSDPSLINKPNAKLGWSVLYRSIICGHQTISEFLLNQGADPNLKSQMGDTALHYASETDQYSAVKLLLQHKADPNIRQNDGETALHLACQKGNNDIVQLLIDYKSDPNIQNTILGKTPLHYAVNYSHVKVVKTLLKSNINLNIQDKHGKTAKDLATDPEIFSLFLESPSGIPSPEPSEILQKSSLEENSVMVARNILEISFSSDHKSVDDKIKGLEDFHKRIREKVRTSVENSRLAYSQSSFLYEPDEEKTAVEAFDKKKMISFGTCETGSELYLWLCKKRLEQCYNLLVSAGYDDLTQIQIQMESMMPINEKALKEIGINKPGLRKRLMLAFDSLKKSEVKLNKGFFNCCTSEIASNMFMVNTVGLDKWLDKLCLKDLTGLFEQNGYEELDQILQLMNTPWEITAEDLAEIGISKPGYRHRILAKLKEDSGGFANVVEKTEKRNDSCGII